MQPRSVVVFGIENPVEEAHADLNVQPFVDGSVCMALGDHRKRYGVRLAQENLLAVGAPHA